MYPTIKIADMGLAKIEASIRNTHCGTHGYLAPECTQGPQLPGLNWAMDIYAVGVTTYETLTGRLPFGNDENADPYERVLPMEPLVRRDCSEMVLDFLEWTLNMDPKDRPSAKECASHPWLLDEINPRQSPRSQRIQPPSTIIVEDDAKTIRPAPPVAAPDSDSDSTRPSSSSSEESSSATSPHSEDETLKFVLRSPKKNLTVRSTVSYVGDPMDICSVKSSPTRKRDISTIRSVSNPMELDTIRPADQVWCTLYPLQGNMVGKSMLSLQKAASTIGSSTEMDFILRHPKIARHHCVIKSQGWTKQSGNTGMIHVHGQKPVQFQHMSKIYLLKESATGI
jgi:serine/threonine protein kinase